MDEKAAFVVLVTDDLTKKNVLAGEIAKEFANLIGGSGGGIATSRADLEARVAWALEQSPTREALIEESVLGWKEYELEVIRDTADNFIVVCSIENLDPMGVHTGDSITVAPAMTLTDRELQRLRDASRAVMTEIGVETGGSNVQFAVNPADGRVLVIEMNPRVSRSSALASKATGYPIAKIAAKLAVGYRLDELTNDITGTSAAFEPTLDYVVVKWPRFAFEKFPGADKRLGPQMKSVGEAMSIGRTFCQALQKAARSLETGRDGIASLIGVVDYRALATDGSLGRDLLMDAPPEPRAPETLPPLSAAELRDALERLVPVASADRLFYVADALRVGITAERLHELTRIDPWFLAQLARIVDHEARIPASLGDARALRETKRLGFSDRQIARLCELTEAEVRVVRERLGVRPVFGRVDTCAAELATTTPYLYSSYEDESEAAPSARRKVIILGGGPNRIGQGIEFDYCCVHASFALREIGFETVMVNSNPETVSTDYDTSDRLYFEPLTLEDVLEIYQQEKCDGVIVQFGGQTPLNLATALKANGVNIIGTSPESIELAEDRKLFANVLHQIGLRQPANRTALNETEALAFAHQVGFPVLLRPSFVLGGRGMFIVYSEEEFNAVIRQAFEVMPGKPVLIDKFLEDAIELDVDCLSDGVHSVIGGMLEHIEFAGVHSGDASMVMPPHTLGAELLDRVRQATHALARELKVIGLMNVQFAIKGDDLYVLEVNPRASRTVPFVAKAIGVPLAKLAAQVMTGRKLADLGFTREQTPKHWCVKEAVFPFVRFPGATIALGPEMRSTGEVMGIDADLGVAFAKAQAAVKPGLPVAGNVFLSVKDADKPRAVLFARRLEELGFTLYSTSGTAQTLADAGVAVKRLAKFSEGRPNAVDMIKNGQIQMVINTPGGMIPRRDENAIRTAAYAHNVCLMTTITGAEAAIQGISALKQKPMGVRPIQAYRGNVNVV